jgi:eukaryotic-like serine/threonine-protein kinase
MLVQGARLGAYEVVGSLGAGAMGEVYRARDTKLQRDVAIKVLPPVVMGDAERSARFTREAHVLASLNHPHIAAIYGLEQDEGAAFLVLELVEGETLDRRIARGALPMDEALPMATQIAEALEAAHEKGIIHRDLKPANIALTTDGQVKLLDFGLAKSLGAASASPPPASLSMAATIAPALVTDAGSLLGTAAYMSPEQARGKDADRRSDVWAFGCVLFEMLTARRAFEGEVVSETLANVLKGDPDWSRLPGHTPPAVRVLLRGCLERNPRQRFGDLSAARVLIAASAQLSPATASAGRRRSHALTLAVGAIAALALAAVGYLSWPRTAPTGPLRILELSLPPTFSFGAVATAVLSPDGTRLAYTAANEQGRIDLMVRDLDGVRVTRLAETNGAHSPFWSPDGRWVAYYNGGQLLRAAPLGGPPEALAPVRGEGRGGAWNARGDVLFTDGTAIKRFSMNDPARTVLAAVEDAQFPAFLADGDRFLYNARGSNAVLLTSLRGAPPRQVLPDAGQTLVSQTGHLLFARGGALLLAPFDSDSGMVTGDAIALERRVNHLPDTGSMGVSIDDRGTLLVRPAATNTMDMRWYDLATGHVDEVALEPFSMGAGGFDLSKDGSRAAISRLDPSGQSDVWIVDVARAQMSRLTSDARFEGHPVWAPDGRGIVFVRRAGGRNELVQKTLSRPDEEVVLFAADATLFPTQWTRDGANIIFSRSEGVGATDVWMLPLADHSASRRLASGLQGQLSPDGKWLAYSSSDTGTSQVYVQPFPEGGEPRVVSGQGGHMPRWNEDGTLLRYVTFVGDLFEVRFDPKTGVAQVPRKMFRTAINTRNAALRYAPAGNRALTVEDRRFEAPLRIVLNWPSLLAR